EPRLIFAQHVALLDLRLVTEPDAVEAEMRRGDPRRANYERALVLPPAHGPTLAPALGGRNSRRVQVHDAHDIALVAANRDRATRVHELVWIRREHAARHALLAASHDEVLDLVELQARGLCRRVERHVLARLIDRRRIAPDAKQAAILGACVDHARARGGLPLL